MWRENTLPPLVIDFVSEGREDRGHHFHQVQRGSLAVVLSLEFVKESPERSPVALKILHLEHAHLIYVRKYIRCKV